MRGGEGALQYGCNQFGGNLGERLYKVAFVGKWGGGSKVAMVGKNRANLHKWGNLGEKLEQSTFPLYLSLASLQP